MKTYKKILLIALVLVSMACFLYLNSSSGLDSSLADFGMDTSELTDVRISKFVTEMLKRVIFM